MGSRRWPLVVALVVVVALAGFAAGYAVHSTAPVATTTVAPSPSTTTAPDPTWVAVWPSAQSSLRYPTPVSAALGFAHAVLGMRGVTAGPFAQGDTRSGEVAIRTTPAGPVTTVLVRQLTSEDSWWVLGASCAELRIAEPGALDTIASPLSLTGSSTAFEGIINYALYQDGVTAPLAAGTAMGGSNGVVAPYAVTVDFAAPTHHYGVLVVSTRSAKDGSVLEASAIRVAFATVTSH